LGGVLRGVENCGDNKSRRAARRSSTDGAPAAFNFSATFLTKQNAAAAPIVRRPCAPLFFGKAEKKQCGGFAAAFA